MRPVRPRLAGGRAGWRAAASCRPRWQAGLTGGSTSCCHCAGTTSRQARALPVPLHWPAAEEGKAAVAAAGGEVPAGVPDFWMIALRNAMEEETVSWRGMLSWRGAELA